MNPVSADFPAWAQQLIVGAGALAVFLGTLYGYIKKGKQPSSGSEVAVVSASFADKRTIESLADAIGRLDSTLRQTSSEHGRVVDAMRDNTDAAHSLQRAIRASALPTAPLDDEMLRFLSELRKERGSEGGKT